MNVSGVVRINNGGSWPNMHLRIAPVDTPSNVTGQEFFDRYPDNTTGDRPFNRDLQYTVSTAGWYRLEIQASGGPWTNPGDYSWQVLVNSSATSSCDPTAMEMYCSCSEAGPASNSGMATSGNPIGTAVGNSHEDATDLAVPTRGGQLEVHRSYNSLVAGNDSTIGFGWANNWSTRLQFDTPSAGDVTVWQPSGTPVVFSATVKNDGSAGAYVAGSWVTATLSKSGSDFVFQLKNGLKYTYGSDGKLKTITNRQGYVTNFAYAAGKLTSVTDADSGKSLSVVWTGNRIDTITDSASRVVNYDYDGSGNLIDATDAGGAHWKFGYDGAHQLTSVRHPNQVAANVTNQDVVNTYTSGKVTLQVDNRVSPALTRQFDYTSIPGATKVIDPKGNVRVDYYTNGRRTKVVDGYGFENVTHTFTYDPNTGAVATVAVGEGAGAVTVATNTYDLAGNLLSSTDALARTTSATYNAYGQPLTVTDPSGVVTTFGYDEGLASQLGRLTSQCSPLGTVPTGGTLKCGDSAATSSTTTWGYATTGNLTDVQSVKDPSQQGTSNATTFTYGADGQVATSTDADTNKTTYCYDNVGRLTSTFSPRAGTVSCTDSSAFKTAFTVDGYGAATGITAPATSPVTRIFDAEHNLTSETGADGNTTTYVYDGASRLIETRQASNTGSPSISKTRWWEDGTVKETEDPAGNVTHYDYDHAARVIAQIDPSGTRNYAYDAFSRVVTAQDPGGNCAATPKTGCTIFGFDNASQLKTVDYSDPGTADVTATAYDNNGRLKHRETQIPGGAVKTSDQGWDSLGRLTSSTVEGTATGYGYDLAGRTTAITYPGYSTPITRTYDAAGRWITTNDGTASGGKTTTFGYDADSNWNKTTFPSAVNTDDYTLDNAGRPTAITYKQGTSTTLGTLNYAMPSPRDGAGRVVNETVGTLSAPNSTYGYNTLGQLNKTNSTTANFTYDAAKNLTSQPGQTQQFNSANQICWSAASGSGACNAAPTGATTYTYDLRGNRTVAARAGAPDSTFTFDQANRMTSASTPAVQGNQGQFHELTPTRILNTPTGFVIGTCNPSPCQRMSTNTVKVKVLGEGGIPTTGVEAVTMDVTAYNTYMPLYAGAVTVWRSDGTQPTGRTLYFASGANVSNRVTTKVGADGYVSLNVVGDAEISFDVQGWYSTATGTAGGNFVSLDPTNVLDTRSSTRNGACPTSSTQCTTLTAGATRTFQVTGRAGVPATGVSAVSVNITAYNAAADGHVKVYRSGTQPVPYITTYYTTGKTVSIASDLKLSASGQLDVYSSAGLDVTVDVVGYWTSPTAQEGGQYIPLDPAQVLDTNGGTGTCTPSPCARIPAGTTLSVQLAGLGGLPTTGIKAVNLNITTYNGSATGAVEVWPSDENPTGLRTLAFAPSTFTSNSLPMDIGADGKIKIKAQSSAAVDIYLNVQGYYSESGTLTTTYTYDNDGLRLTKTNPYGATTTYRWDKTNPLIPLLLTETTGTNTTRYIYGPGGTPYEQINPDGSITYLHRDQLGSTRLLTNSTGTNVGERAYTPYGKPSTTTGTATTPFGYAGQYTDPETGYQYLRARYYDPATAQFISRDPAVVRTMESYGYAARNPLNASDPSGMWCTFGHSWGFGDGCDDSDSGDHPKAGAAGRAPRTVTAYATVLQTSSTGVFVHVGVGDWYQRGNPGTVSWELYLDGDLVDENSFKYDGDGNGRGYTGRYACAVGTWTLHVDVTRSGHGSVGASAYTDVTSCDEDQVRQQLGCRPKDYDSWWNPFD